MVCRVKTNPKNAINEHFLPRFLDFIVWGHEHECLVDPQVCCFNISYVGSDRHVLCKLNMDFNFLQEVPGMGFHISQPGSSVATSLIDGESKPKHVLLLEIKVVYIMRNLMTLHNSNYCHIYIFYISS